MNNIFKLLIISIFLSLPCSSFSPEQLHQSPEKQDNLVPSEQKMLEKTAGIFFGIGIAAMCAGVVAFNILDWYTSHYLAPLETHAINRMQETIRTIRNSLRPSDPQYQAKLLALNTKENSFLNSYRVTKNRPNGTLVFIDFLSRCDRLCTDEYPDQGNLNWSTERENTPEWNILVQRFWQWHQKRNFCTKPALVTIGIGLAMTLFCGWLLTLSPQEVKESDEQKIG